MNDRSLDERWMVVTVGVVEEIVQQGVERFRWRRNERCRAGVVAAAAVPVLRRADDAADVRHRGLLHQDPVDREEVVECDRVVRRAELDGSLHRGDVGEHLDSDPIRSVTPLGEHDLGVEQPAWPGLEAFDLRGRNGLGA